MTSVREYCSRQAGALVIYTLSYLEQFGESAHVTDMDCFYQASRIRQPTYFNPPALMYGYGVPTYYSQQFFPVSRNSEIHRPPVITRSPPLLGESVPNPVIISESNASTGSTTSQTPPHSPSESSTETNETTCSELNDEPCHSGKDVSESEEKTG